MVTVPYQPGSMAHSSFLRPPDFGPLPYPPISDHRPPGLDWAVCRRLARGEAQTTLTGSTPDKVDPAISDSTQDRSCGRHGKL